METGLNPRFLIVTTAFLHEVTSQTQTHEMTKCESVAMSAQAKLHGADGFIMGIPFRIKPSDEIWVAACDA